MDSWSLLRRFAAAYADPLVPADAAPVRAAEQRLALRLPPAFHELYSLLDDRDELTRGQDRLLPPAELYTDGGVLVFRHENQHVTRWGVALAALNLPDPPVLFEVDHGWRPYLPSLSLAGTELAMSEWILGGSEDTSDNRDSNAALLAVLEGACRPVPLPAYPMWPEPDGPPTRWFTTGDALLRADGETWLWVRATGPDALTAVRRTLPGDWMAAPGQLPGMSPG